MKYIILDSYTGATIRMQEIKSAATSAQEWLSEYDTYQLTINNQIINKGAFAYITGLTSYYTAGEISAATDLTRDWYLLGFRQVIKNISVCPKTGLQRKVMLRHLSIDSGEVKNDLSQPVANQKIKGTYNVITLALDGTVAYISQDEYITTSALALSQYDYSFGAGIASAVLAKLDSIFD